MEKRDEPKLTGPEELCKHWDDRLQAEYVALVTHIEETMRKESAGSAGSVHIPIAKWPSAAVKRRIEEGYRKAGWKTAEFKSNQRDGEWISLKR